MVKQAVNAIVEVVGGATQSVIAVKSPGYAPYFEELGDHWFVARFRAGFVRYRAGLILRAHAEEREVRTSLYALARRRRWHPKLARHAVV